MTSQLRPGVVIMAVLALAAGVIGLRTLAGSESDGVPEGQPFVVEADYPSSDQEEVPPEPGWVRPPGPRNPFVADAGTPLAVTDEGGADSLTVIPDGPAASEGSGLTADDPAATGQKASEGSSTLEPAAPLSNAAPPPDPGEVVEIDIGPDDPNGLGG